MAHMKSSKKRARTPVNEVTAIKARPQERIVAGVCAALVLACIAIYGRTLLHGFVYFDDGVSVTDNPYVQLGLNLKSIGWAFVTEKGLYFQPLAWMSHMLDCSLYGMHPWGHHATSLILHAAASVLLFLALRLLTGTLWQSAAVAALFAVHPLNVESVAWVAERKGVLSAFFWMLALGAYGRYARRGGAGRYAVVAAAFVLGLMSKPMTVTLPFTLLLLDYWPLGRVNRAASPGVMARKAVWLAVEKVPLFLITVLSCLSTFVMQAHGNNIDFGESVPFAGRCANAVVVYVLYLAQTVWPSGLAVFYPYPSTCPIWQVVGAALILAAISLFCVRRARRHPYLIVGWLWYLGTLVPVIGLVRVGDFSHADRYTYIPLVGIFIMVVWGTADLAAAWRVPRRVLAGASSLMLVILAVCAAVQAGHWRDTGTLFRHAIDVGQRSCVAFNNLGKFAMDRGLYDEAKDCLVKALDLNPGYAGALTNLGVLAMDQGHYEEARTCLTKVLDLDPADVQVLNNLGVLAIHQRRYDEAEVYLRKVLDLNPEHVNALCNLGGIAMDRERYDEALGYLEEALRLAPSNIGVLNNMGKVAVVQRRYKEAKTYLTKSLDLDPGNINALITLGGCHMAQGQLEEALGYFRAALGIDPKCVPAMRIMAAALTQLGRKEEAEGYTKRVAELSQFQVDHK